MIMMIMMLTIPISNAEINWDFPYKIEAGSLYESSISITDLQDNQMIIVGEFFPRGTLIVDYEVEGVYEEDIRSYIGEEEDYLILQMRAKDEYAKIILNLIAPNKEEDTNLNSELVYILSPSEFGTLKQALNITVPVQMEFPIGIDQEDDKSKLNYSQWLMIMSLLLLATAVLVIKEESIHDTSLVMYSKAKVLGKQYYKIGKKKVGVLMEKTRDYGIQKGILKGKSSENKEKNSSKIKKSKAQRRPLKRKIINSKKRK